MTDCPTCSYPLVWSDDHRRQWCSVYGDHRAPLETTPARFIEPAHVPPRLRAVS